ncbi:cytochrome C biogenesis protein [Serinicoccus chungangensis]|uniref:Cytochrome C biogenesis protein n=1 Tax=Serinicoccus chungangensis TaxID=767452 RepID=A0A0W8I2D7_9MICO|nr:hypothetical protein [Serinicoccus chungangensis]KUG51902.1 cytochrome C biogenesis protein [Serinicoccus chungangensis]
MLALLGALVAGVLTTLAPCVLPLLPVIVGGSLVGDGSRAAQARRAVVVAGSLGLSVAAFTLVLKGTTALIGVPPEVWRWLSGGILLVLGVVMLAPRLWEQVSARLGLAAYCLGLSATLLAVALAGQGLVRRLGWAADPRGWLQRGFGLVFVAVGIAVGLGWDRELQAWILEHSPVAPWELDSGFIPER